MKKLAAEKVFIAVLLFLSGAGSVWTAQKLWGNFHAPEPVRHSPYLARDFIFRDDLFEKVAPRTLADVKTIEDENFVTMEISIEKEKQDRLDVKVENGQVMISGETEKREEGKYFGSSFSRSFPVPSNADSAKVKIENHQDRVILKFPKVETQSSGV